MLDVVVGIINLTIEHSSVQSVQQMAIIDEKQIERGVGVIEPNSVRAQANPLGRPTKIGLRVGSPFSALMTDEKTQSVEIRARERGGGSQVPFT